MVEHRSSKPITGVRFSSPALKPKTETKCCARCKERKPVADFAKKRANDYQPYCRECQQEYRREHYRKNRPKYLAKVKNRKAHLLSLLRRAKDKPCADCGVKYPYYVMDLDHREGELKLGNFAAVIRWGALTEKSLQAEIAKCDVVCANCHRIRTHRRNQYGIGGRGKTSESLL